MTTGEVNCYNKGCGKKFDPISNDSEECVYHSGEPVFHDVYKYWSCCDKKTTDFTEFLNIKGCCRAKHNGEKPVVEEKKSEGEVKIQPSDIKPPERMVRPSDNEPVVPLPSIISPSLQKLLNNLQISDTSEDTEVTKDAICQRKGCGKSKSEEDQPCVYHPGSPIFHEGLKFWSCCKKRTTDFNEFLAQKGCEKGSHAWANPNEKKIVECRHDWHQTGDQVNFTVYAKKVHPDRCAISCNPVKLEVEIVFGENQVFSFNKVLAGIIDPEKSKVTFSTAKVEVSMRKAEFVAWPSTFVL